ncbi:MAG: OmpA family protein [Acidobacteriota bacterium]
MKRFFVCVVLILFGPSGAFLWSEERKLMATLATDASRAETVLNVYQICTGTVGRRLLIESRNGALTEAGDIKHIYGNFIVLKRRLRNDFLAGSSIYQGSAFVVCEPVTRVVDKDKQPPSIVCEPPNVRVTEAESTTLQVSASDPNNDPLTYTWAVDGEAVSNNQTFFQFEATGLSIGDHTAQVVVTDVDGMSANCDFHVIIEGRPNRDPSVTLTLDKSDIYAGEMVSASAQASDPDDDPLTYFWAVDGQSRSETESSVQIDTTGLAGGRHSVGVSVVDDRDASASDMRSFLIREKVVIQMDKIRPDNLAKAKLDEIALRMQQDPQLELVITGHTDDQGSETENEQIGQQRSEAVKDYLVKQHNIGASRIETRSAGQSQPIADDQTDEERKKNRRVEIELFVP